jgi:RNase P subunit RPR2
MRMNGQVDIFDMLPFEICQVKKTAMLICGNCAKLLFYTLEQRIEFAMKREKKKKYECEYCHKVHSIGHREIPLKKDLL